MATYQDIIDYMNKNYHGEFTLFKHDNHYTITNVKDSISIYNQDYKSTFYIGVELCQLLIDVLSTPVNQRNTEIEHTFKPVTKRNLENYEIKCLDSADKIIGNVNSFILKEFSIDPSISLLLLTTFDSSKLLQVLDIFKDFDITIKHTKKYFYPKGYAYTLSIKYK